MVKKVYIITVEMKAWVEKQENFSQYVRDLIERDMAMAYMRDVAPGMVRLVEGLYEAKSSINSSIEIVSRDATTGNSSSSLNR